MHGEVEDGGVLLEQVLGAVPVMDIPVHDEHSGQSGVAERAGGDGDVVEEAKPHGEPALGVMSGRTHGGEASLHLARGDRAGQGKDRSRREAGDLRAARADGGVPGVEQAGAPRHHRLHVP